MSDPKHDEHDDDDSQALPFEESDDAKGDDGE